MPVSFAREEVSTLVKESIWIFVNGNVTPVLPLYIGTIIQKDCECLFSYF
jgi:hypothetical protein